MSGVSALGKNPFRPSCRSTPFLCLGGFGTLPTRCCLGYVPTTAAVMALPLFWLIQEGADGERVSPETPKAPLSLRAASGGVRGTLLGAVGYGWLCCCCFVNWWYGGALRGRTLIPGGAPPSSLTVSLLGWAVTGASGPFWVLLSPAGCPAMVLVGASWGLAALYELRRGRRAFTPFA
ncbi:hypothetical protein NDU88_006618 [Pleurodeles waltl]|uniref:Uncharacterized protein n=1 Tax=Pleurodeles waltl TaxID=8319 RepID=A0AAV7VR75_PLEWA|nr:hypothetical protein NDU88_006618 [Pleurodeles waltl]